MRKTARHNFLVCLGVVISASLFGCAGQSKFMKPAAEAKKPTADKALVRFMRPSGFGFGINFNMLDGEHVIGNSVAKSQFDYLADPGHHTFAATAENKAFMEAELEAGKTYYAITRIYPGAWTARVAFVPVNRNSENWETVLDYEKSLQRLDPDVPSLSAWAEQNREKIQKLWDGYHSEWKDKYEWPRLLREDGR